MGPDSSQRSEQREWQIILNNQPGELERLAILVHDFARAISLDRERTHALDLALTEWVTNIISYGFNSEGEGKIVVRLASDETSVTAEVEDDGKPFNPIDHPVVNTSLPLDEKPMGGLGLHLMRKFIDEISYERRGNKNWLRLRKLWRRSS